MTPTFGVRASTAPGNVRPTRMAVGAWARRAAPDSRYNRALMSKGLVAVALMALIARVAVAGDAVLPEVGGTVPDFSLPTLGGETMTLSEQVGAGPVVLVFFRGVW